MAWPWPWLDREPTEDELELEPRFWALVERHDVPRDLAEYHLELAYFDLYVEPGWNNVADNEPRGLFWLAMRRINEDQRS